MKTRQTRASHGSLRAIVLGLVGLGVHAVAAQQQDEGRGPRADDVLELNVPLAGRAELKRHPEADQELLDMLSRFLRTREEPSHRRRGGRAQDSGGTSVGRICR